MIFYINNGDNMSKLNLKKKKNKKHKIKYFMFLILIYFTFCYTFYYYVEKNKKENNKIFINFLLKGGNISTLSDYKLTKIVNNTMSYFLKINFENPKTLLNTSILKYNKKSKEKEDDYSNLEELKQMSSFIEDPNHTDITKPILYLYNTHQLENYSSDSLELYGITPNVQMASYILKEKMNKLGIATVVEEANLSEYLSINNWDYSSSYKASRVFMLEKKITYPTLKYFIDIHRDSVSSTIDINNKKYARILFVVGLEHKNYQSNLDTANKVNSLINKYYPKLSKGVLQKQGKGVNGIYNQDISSNVMLIEVGGNENTIEEVFNSIEALSVVLNEYIKGESNE